MSVPYDALLPYGEVLTPVNEQINKGMRITAPKPIIKARITLFEFNPNKLVLVPYEGEVSELVPQLP